MGAVSSECYRKSLRPPGCPNHRMVVELLSIVFAWKGLLYIDPGTGTLLWQLAVGVGVGFLFYLRKVRDWFRDLFTGSNSDSSEP